MQAVMQVSPANIQRRPAGGWQSCDNSALTSSKLILPGADCWQLIILATPMSKAFQEREGGRSAFFFFLSRLTAGLPRLNSQWTLAMFFIYIIIFLQLNVFKENVFVFLALVHCSVSPPTAETGVPERNNLGTCILYIFSTFYIFLCKTRGDSMKWNIWAGILQDQSPPYYRTWLVIIIK